MTLCIDDLLETKKILQSINFGDDELREVSNFLAKDTQAFLRLKELISEKVLKKIKNNPQEQSFLELAEEFTNLIVDKKMDIQDLENCSKIVTRNKDLVEYIQDKTLEKLLDF